MATIRDVVEAFSRRAGVDAVVVVGRDGLPIDSRTTNGVDAENVAALLPSVINGMTQLGQAGGGGGFGPRVVEFAAAAPLAALPGSEEDTPELQSQTGILCPRLLLKKKNGNNTGNRT